MNEIKILSDTTVLMEGRSYYNMVRELDLYRERIGDWVWELEKKYQYERGCRKSDQEPNPDVLKGHDDSIYDAALSLREAYETFSP